MKVLVIPSWYPSKSYPNNGSFFKEQAEAFKGKCDEVSILVVEIPYRGQKKDYRYFVKNYTVENGIPVYRYVFPLGILHRFPKLHYRFIKYVSSAIYKKEFYKKDQEPYSVHAHSYRIGGFIGICLKEKFGCRCVITEHTSKILKNEINAVERDVLKQCVEYSDSFVCVSKNLKNKVENMTGILGKVKVHPNMVNSMFDYVDKKKDHFSFVSVGNLKKEKQMDLLIKAFCETFSENENVTLTIVGGGPENDNLKNMITKYKRDHQIFMTGELDRKEVQKVLEEGNVMALVSERETFGIAYVEGLLCGNVLVGTHNGGADDIIQDTNGIISEDMSIVSVGNAMRGVYNNYSRYNRKEISAFAKEKYGEEAFVKFYLALLECEK